MVVKVLISTHIHQMTDFTPTIRINILKKFTIHLHIVIIPVKQQLSLHILFDF